MRTRITVFLCVLALLAVYLAIPTQSQTVLTSREAVNRLARFNSPGDLVDQITVNFTSSTNTTTIFGDGSWDMDYADFFTETAACSLAPTLKTARLDATASIDTTYFYVPAGTERVIVEQWGGVKLKGMGTGSISFRAVGHVTQ